MAKPSTYEIGFHGHADASAQELAPKGPNIAAEVSPDGSIIYSEVTEITYTFENFFHPFVGKLIEKLNRESLTGMLDPKGHQALSEAVVNPPDRNTLFTYFKDYKQIGEDLFMAAEGFPKEIDLRVGGPYANYNWELLFHIPVTIAVHLSKNQRFAEAQRWFHYLFDPTCNDTSVPPPGRFWKFLAFRKGGDVTQIDELLALLSKTNPTPAEASLRDSILNGYQAIKEKPFQPHAVARTRQLAYQYFVVMKYLDNLIAWGDSLFRQDTVESINEATQRYVLAANLLGPRPQRIPPRGSTRPKSFAELKKQGYDAMGNALVELEGEFPFNLSAGKQGGSSGGAEPLFGIGRTLYFAIPRNERLLGYWDTVADRLFKIRHCMNIEGVVRQLALFDPPIDPGMLVKAAAAGIDIGSILSGLNQPVGPVRSLLLVQKALELTAEVRGLGGALLGAIEKGDSERLALLRQGHETKVQQLSQEVRFLQWKQAQESTETLLRGRATVLERYRYYRGLLGLKVESSTAPDKLPLDRRILTEANFDEAYAALVGQYERAVATQSYPKRRLVAESSPAGQSGAAGQGNLYLTSSEDADLNQHAPSARDFRIAATVSDSITQVLALMPDFGIDLHWWGLGGNSKIIGGSTFAAAGRIVAGSLNTKATHEESLGVSAVKTASYERRADEWMLHMNLAARELIQIGRQLIGSLIAEQVTYREYQNIQKQIEQSQEMDRFLREKFTNADLYAWMQGEITRLYYEYYRFAFDTARRAEQSMKRELMRPEVDATEYIKFNYWDAGRKGLLSGEALFLDLKRMEMAYHEHNQREYELTKHISLRQLDPLALLRLKAEGSCEVTLPEWLFDLDGPGHYMRRIKQLSLSIPSVTGPYTSVNCTLTLLKSSVRKSPLLKDGEYGRQGSEDSRFVDYVGATQSIVTSSGSGDSGLFEANLRDERLLPFEGAGALSTWRLELPDQFRQFDYATITDLILHLRYTARQGGSQLREKGVEQLESLVGEASSSGMALLLSLKHEFPAEWQRFAGGSGSGSFTATVKRLHFPYLTRGRSIVIDKIRLHAVTDEKLTSSQPQGLDLSALGTALGEDGGFTLTLSPDAVLSPSAQGHLFLLISYSLAEA